MSDLKALLATLDEFAPTFQKANEVDPSKAQTVGDGVGQAASLGFLNMADQLYVRNALHKLPTAEIETLFTRMLVSGVGKGRSAEGFFASSAVQSAIARDEMLTNALDTSGGSVLVRQDLDPLIQELTTNSSLGW